MLVFKEPVVDNLGGRSIRVIIIVVTEELAQLQSGRRPKPPAVVAAADRAPTLPASQRDWQQLTTRERAVSRLVGQAMTNGQIARRLHVTTHTVNYHLRQIFRKLDLRSRVQLARLVAEAEDLDVDAVE